MVVVLVVPLVPLGGVLGSTTAFPGPPLDACVGKDGLLLLVVPHCTERLMLLSE